jgi:hypothetical protein
VQEEENYQGQYGYPIGRGGVSSRQEIQHQKTNCDTYVTPRAMGSAMDIFAGFWQVSDSCDDTQLVVAVDGDVESARLVNESVGNLNASLSQSCVRRLRPKAPWRAGD